jgi:hypothetical protein
MGALDDAIREHLELKRKHGAAEEEVTAKQQEAQRTGALPVEPGETLPPAPAPDAKEEAAEPLAPDPQDTASKEPHPVDPLPPVEEAEPDEVLPEEALEMGLPATETSGYAEPEPVPSTADLVPEEPETNGAGHDEGLLEETPDFLEDMPEQDRLWFEQKPPKDFDFDE